jgi:hypothetical protein
VDGGRRGAKWLRYDPDPGTDACTYGGADSRSDRGAEPEPDGGTHAAPNGLPDSIADVQSDPEPDQQPDAGVHSWHAAHRRGPVRAVRCRHVQQRVQRLELHCV